MWPTSHERLAGAPPLWQRRPKPNSNTQQLSQHMTHSVYVQNYINKPRLSSPDAERNNTVSAR